MNNESKKEKISLEALEMISGGTGEDWSELARRMYDNSEHETDSGNDDDLWTHSKAKKGNLYRR